MSRLCNRILYNFLVEVKIKAHPIYALMLGLPKENLYLVRHYDFANDIAFSPCVVRNKFSLREYIAGKDDFHPQDLFELFFDADLGAGEEDYTSIGRAEEATIPSLRKHVNIFLKAFCEKQLRHNTPFELNSETIARYGFKPADIRELRRSVVRYNKAAKERIRAEYDELYKLDFIRTGE